MLTIAIREAIMADIKKLFVFSNTYTARVLLKCAENTISDTDIEFVLLSELGISCDVGITIHELDTIQQCVEFCTQVLIVRDTIIPKSKIDLVTSLANSQNKCCTTVDGFYSSKDIFHENRNLNQDFIERPLILIASYGSRTQLSCWETAICKLLYNNKIKVFSTPSDELKSVLEWFSLCNLTKHYATINADSKLDCEVEVRGVHLNSIDNYEYDRILTQLKPDVIMISMCNNYSDYDDIRNIFKFRYGRIIDFFAKSELMKMIDENGNEKIIFDFSSFCNEKEFVVSLKDPLLVQRLSKLILPKIKLPDGVMII